MIKMNEMKRCSKCKRTLNLSEFTISNKSKDKHQNYCRECRIEYSRTKRIPSPHKEVIPRDHLDSEIELLQMENKRLKVRFDKILFLYLNDEVIL